MPGRLSSRRMFVQGMSAGALVAALVRSRKASALLGLGGGAAGSLITSYGALTNTDVYVEPSTPTWGAAGTTLVDSVFGTTLYRVTDTNTASSWKAGHSWYPNDGSAEACRWSAGDAGFLVLSDGGEELVYDWNGSSATMLTFGTPSTPYVGSSSGAFQSCAWDATNARLVYGQLNNTLSSFELDTYAVSTIVDYTAIGVGGPADVCVSAANLMTCRLGAQDTAIYAAAYQIGGGGTDLVLNTNTGALVNHSGTSEGSLTMYAGGSVVSWISFDLHNVRTGRDGNYCILTPTGATVGSYTNCTVVWDIVGGTLSVVSVDAAGHNAAAYGYLANNYYGTYAYQQFIRSLTSQSGIANPAQLFAVTENDPNGDSYLSWVNAVSSTMMPVLWSTVDDGETGVPSAVSVPWQREICAIQTSGTNGSQTVWRFCHHYSYYNQFYDGVHAAGSRTGAYALFGSSWGFTLGTPDPSQGDDPGTYRDDVFVANLLTAS